MNVKNKGLGKPVAGLLIVILVTSLYISLALTAVSVYAKPSFLDVTVSPSMAKLYAGESRVFVASCLCECEVSYVWSAKATDAITVLVNGVLVDLTEEPKIIAAGASVSFQFVGATEAAVSLTVKAECEELGLTGFGDAVVYDPYTSAGIYMDALPAMAAQVCEADGHGWYHAISRIGQQGASSTNSTDVIQYAINASTTAGGMVFVRGGTYSATVSVKMNTTLVLDYGVSGVSYSIAAGATCTVIDYAGKLRRDYSAGSLAYQFDYATGNELISSANITTIYATNIDAISTGSGVHVLRLVVENGTSMPASPLECQVFFETDTGLLWIYNNTVWTQIGATAYSNLTGTPDLTVYLTHDGSTALSGAWNAGGSYGIYGVPTLNSTTVYVSTVDELTSGGGVKVLKFIMENGTSFPVSPVDHQLFYRTDLSYLYAYNNSGWVQLGTCDYNNLTNTPDLTVYLTKDGSRALTGHWNVGGSYGIYGVTMMNATTLYVSTIDELVSGSGVKILKLIVENGTTSYPSNPINCQIWYNTTSGILYIYNSTGTSWTEIGAGGGVTSYNDLTDLPDLTVYLNKAGTVALTGNWNVGGSYGIYGCVWLNSTNANIGTYYLSGEQLGFVTMPNFIVDKSGSTYRAWHGGNLTLFTSSANFTGLVNNNLLASSVTIDFRAASYTLNGSLRANGYQNLTLQSANGAIFTVASGMDADAIYFSSCVNCLFDHIQIQGNSANQNVAINASNGIKLVDCVNCKIVNPRIDDIQIFGVNVYGASTRFVGVEGGKITNCGWNGITLGYGAVGDECYANGVEVAYCGDVGISPQSLKVTVTGCWVHDMNGTNGSTNSRWGIGCENAHYSVIANNIVENCTLGYQSDGDYNNFIGNTAFNCTEAFHFDSTATGCTMRSLNVYTYYQPSQIYGTECVAENNYFRSTVVTTFLNALDIFGNNDTVRNNDFYDASGADPASTASSAISIKNSVETAVVEGNRLIYGFYYGMWIGTSCGSNKTEVAVSNNHFEGCVVAVNNSTNYRIGNNWWTDGSYGTTPA